MIKKYVLSFFITLNVSSVLFAQLNREVLNAEQIESKMHENKLNGLSPYTGMENEFIVKTNLKQLSVDETDKINASFKRIDGVIDCVVFPEEHLVKVSSGVKSSIERKIDAMPEGKEKKVAKENLKRDERNNKNPDDKNKKYSDFKKRELLSISKVKAIFVGLGVEITSCEENIYKSVE